MPGKPVKVGPWSGGLNTYSEPPAVGDTECIDIQNFDIDLDGSLYSRAPFWQRDPVGTVPGSGEIKLLGWFVNTDLVRYLIMSCVTGTYARNESTGSWSTITTTFAAAAYVQYANKAYLIAPPNSSNPGGYWVPDTFTAVAAIQKGATAVIYKERLFIAGGYQDISNANRVYFSDAANFSAFDTAKNFFDARAGDGQHILKMMIYQDTIVLFKEDSTYAFSYESSPARGAVRVINSSVGLSNSDCAIEFENSIYTQHGNYVYQFTNWNFNQVNLKVPFKYSVIFGEYDSSISLSIVNNRLLVHYYDMIYVFNLRSGVWTKWATSSKYNFNRFIKVPQTAPSDPETYYAGIRKQNTGASTRTIIAWSPVINNAHIEEMNCYVTTKVFDFNVPYTYKRLFWWGVDIMSKRDLTYKVMPISYTTAVTHDQMAAYTHDQLVGSHQHPFDVVLDVTNSINISNVTGYRFFAKLLKSMRFRQVNFIISGTTDGTPITGPLRVYSGTIFVDNKEVVSKQLS